MILLFKASLVVIFLLSFYKLFLERESFFKANRIYLLACLVLACALPFVVLPKMIQHQGYVDNLFEETVAEPTHDDNYEHQLEPINNISTNIQNLESENTHNPILSNKEKSIASNEIENNLRGLAPIINAEKPVSKGWSFWLLCIYLFGVIVLIINLLGQVINVVLKVMKNNDKIEDEGVVIVNMTGDIEPCSFFKYIFINPGSYDFETYEQIIAHEKVHVNKRHSIDLLLSEIAVIILWFNPFVWLLRMEVEKNLEYQTDEALITYESEIKESYQLNLVKIACNTSPLAITTNYNQSLIKQRIMRMNAKRSNQFNYWKYAFCMPLVFVLLLILNRPMEGISQSANLSNDDGPEQILDISQENIDQPINEKKDIEIDNTPSIIPKEKVNKIKKSEAVKQPEILDSKLIADCEEFEKAVASGDLELVKRILKTLDPDCLKVKKKNGNNLTTVEKMVKEKKKELNKKSEKLIEPKGSSCEKLRIARDESNELEIKNILMNEDITCMQDIYGNPSQDLNLIKDLLNYGAHVSIDRKGVISISSVGFYIDISDTDAEDCVDPNYIKLKEAIKNQNRSAIKKIISGELLTCPLNEDGKTNDFIFMKKIMKFKPNIFLHSPTAITVKGIGFVIDIDKYVDLPDGYGVSYDEDPHQYYQQSSILEDIQKRLNEISENPENASCLHLIDAVTVGDYGLVKEFLKSMGTECFHRETATTTVDEETLSTSKVSTPLKEAIRRRNLDMVRLFLDQDADLNYTGYGKETPLIVAVKTGNDKMVKLLVSEGADMNREDEAKMSALGWAKYYKFDSIVKFLESKGAR